MLFAAANVVSLAAPKDCVIRNVESAQKLNLDACRPASVTITEKAKVLQSLPAEGAISDLGKSERRKLEAVGQLLHASGRAGVYEIKIISVPQAVTALYERVVLLISLRALTLVSSEELEALVAHEIGHEYVWQQYADAKACGDKRELRELELACDVIAMRLLSRAGIPPGRLQTAVEKITWYNRERLGVALNIGNYPSLKERRRLIEQMSLLER